MLSATTIKSQAVGTTTTAMISHDNGSALSLRKASPNVTKLPPSRSVASLSDKIEEKRDAKDRHWRHHPIGANTTPEVHLGPFVDIHGRHDVLLRSGLGHGGQPQSAAPVTRLRTELLYAVKIALARTNAATARALSRKSSDNGTESKLARRCTRRQRMARPA
jgi:hypothetical protein